MGRQNPKINGKSNVIQTKITQRSIHIHTHKKEKNIYIVAPKIHHFNFGMIRCLFRYSRDAGVHQVDCGDLICCS